VSAFVNPALKAFVTRIGSELTFAQIVIRASKQTFDLRHVSDRERAARELRKLALDDLRAVAQFTASGAFRPLKSAPNLRTGWRFVARDEEELEPALNRLYPGAVADWFAAQSPHPPVTNYRDFTGRQTGMYRVTTMLTDAQTAQVARACCHKSFCLKRRLWIVNGLTPETVEEKSLIPCLEPCAVLLEFARKTARIEQEEKMTLELSPGETATLMAAVEITLRHPEGGLREADFNAPANPRRLQLLREKLAALPISPS
jgi:hypothetical protein